MVYFLPVARRKAQPEITLFIVQRAVMALGPSLYLSSCFKFWASMQLGHCFPFQHLPSTDQTTRRESNFLHKAYVSSVRWLAAQKLHQLDAEG